MTTATFIALEGAGRRLRARNLLLTVLLGLGPSLAAAQEDAYLSCPEEVACYTSDGCHRDRAGALFFTIYDGGQRVVVVGLGDQPLALGATETNVYQVEMDEGVWFILLADDWSRFYMVQAFPQLQDAAAITGPCERRPYQGRLPRDPSASGVSCLSSWSGGLRAHARFRVASRRWTAGIPRSARSSRSEAVDW